MGTVWQARDTRLDRPVAVKLAADAVFAESDAREARRRLRHEAIAIGAMTEPRIARVYDFLEADDDAFIVMELVNGESLAARLDRDQKLSADEALLITMQCAQALESAHRAGIVHRDVKPSNIMLAEDGVKVVDFGIAATARHTLTRTANGAVGLVGTAAYISPERAMGAPASPPADFYALGVVLYQMLSGRLPYAAEEPLSVLYAHVTMQPLPLSDDIPASLSALCMRLLDKNPYARPTSVAAMNTALESTVPEPSEASEEPEAPEAPEPSEQSAPSEASGRRTDRTALGKPLAAVVLGAAVLIAVTAWVTLDMAGPPAVASVGPSQVSSSTASGSAHDPRQGASPDHGSSSPIALSGIGAESDSTPGMQSTLTSESQTTAPASATTKAHGKAKGKGKKKS
jgi:eukaryotic-like serine/threonine-protein kinase